MFKSWLPYYLGPEDSGSGGGGTTENAAGSVTSGTEPTSSGNISSGTASDAMIKAAMAASSADGSPAGSEAGTAALTAGIVGDTSKAAVPGKDGTTEPTSTGQPPTDPATTTGQREAPEARIVAATRNARAEVEAKYAWAKDLNPQRVSVAMELGHELSTDPRAFAAKLASELGMTLVPANQPAQSQSQPTDISALKLPKARLRSEDGQGAYAEDQMPEIVKAIVEHVTGQLDGRIKPLVEDRENAQRRAQADKEFNAQRETVMSALAEARTLPHFTKENEPRILAILQAIPAEKRYQLGPIASMNIAYNTFMKNVILPGIEAAAEERVRASWGKKAATSMGSGHPTDQGGSGKPAQVRDGDVSGLAARMAQMAAQATS